MLTNEAKKQILTSVLEIVENISDQEYQKRVWIRGEPPGTDFDETVNLFADIGDPILENYQDCGITDNQYQISKKFRGKFEAFSEENGLPAAFIDTPEWNEITELAKKVLQAFDYQK